MTNIIQDIRYALRNLRNSPVFAAIAVITLALGIGANTAIFTVVNAVFFHPIPVKDPARLVEIFTLDQRKIFGAANNNVLPNSFPNAQDIQQRLVRIVGFDGTGETVHAQIVAGHGSPPWLAASRPPAVVELTIRYRF